MYTNFINTNRLFFSHQIFPVSLSNSQKYQPPCEYWKTNLLVKKKTIKAYQWSMNILWILNLISFYILKIVPIYKLMKRLRASLSQFPWRQIFLSLNDNSFVNKLRERKHKYSILTFVSIQTIIISNLKAINEFIIRQSESWIFLYWWQLQQIYWIQNS